MAQTQKIQSYDRNGYPFELEVTIERPETITTADLRIVGTTKTDDDFFSDDEMHMFRVGVIIGIIALAAIACTCAIAYFTLRGIW